MPTETIRVPIPADAYTAVTSGHYNVFIRPTSPVPMRLHVGQNPPAIGTENYLSIASSGISLADLEGGDNVYLLAEGDPSEVIVIRGG